MDIYLFLLITSLGIALPFTIVLLINLTMVIRLGDTYQVDLGKLGKVYIVALLAWSVFTSIILGGVL